MTTPLLNVLGLPIIMFVMPLLHMVWIRVLGTTCGVGSTIIVNSLEGPSHVIPPNVKWGVTVIVAVTGESPVFIALNDGISPDPEAARPIDI